MTIKKVLLWKTLLIGNLLTTHTSAHAPQKLFLAIKDGLLAAAHSTDPKLPKNKSNPDPNLKPKHSS